MRISWIFSIALTLLAGSSAQAAVACIDNFTQLQLVLDAAAHDGEDDDIRIHGGTFVLDAPLAVSSIDPRTLAIRGGWNADCSEQNGTATVFDGQNVDALIDATLPDGALLYLDNLTLIRGGGDFAGAVLIQGSGNAVVQRSIFLANTASSFGAVGGLFVDVVGSFVVRNNLFVGNNGPSGAAIVSGVSDCYVFGNTVVGNTGTDADGAGGIDASCSSSAVVLLNNILWDNDGGDLHSDTMALLYNNDIGISTGAAPDPESRDNLSTEPEFAGGILNFHLDPTSALVNRGLDGYGGIGGELALGEFDLAGQPRIQGAHADLGAYESDVLFRDGFQAPP